MTGKPGWDSKRNLSDEARSKRKRLLTATLVTCVAGAFLGGVFHTLFLARGRVAQMQAHSTYDAKKPDEVAKHVQAAGEYLDAITRKQGGVSTYTVASAEALLRDDLWKRLAKKVTVPAGNFIMGTDRPESDIQDRPRHKVYVKAFKIDKYPITNAQYALFVAETGHKAPSSWKQGSIPKGEELRPVTNVFWQDAMDFCTWSDGGTLPTEAQWEKAARGTDARRWPWGNRMTPKLLNTYNNYGRPTSVFTHMKGASPYGAIDMAGNVSEWVKNDFKPYQGSSAPSSMFIPKGDHGAYITSEHYKALRGGSWKSDPFSTTTYHRNYAMAGDSSDFIGFRCAYPVKKTAQKGKE
ncbi:MAG TPA: SUMF1/EgtB/PvdO family nonheme iron enzyme [Mariprofundaceae bacterium]|nr:SUMF1/EgtB/PvdO family nonheme iron enzyme [Mariprofundaceae bacterium]